MRVILPTNQLSGLAGAVQLDASNAVIRTYRYAHIFFFFTLAWGGEYALATLTESGWARRPIAKEDARALLGGKDLNPHPWKRFSLILAVVVIAVIGISSAFARSSTNLNGHSGSQQAWIDYFNGTNGTISQLNALAKQPLSPSVTTATVSLLTTLENSPDSTLNNTVTNAITLCQSSAASCNSAIDSAGRAYNAALDEAGREGLVNVIPASSQ